MYPKLLEKNKFKKKKPNNLTALSIATSCVVLVDPAVAETWQDRSLVREFITEDFPTFGNPTTAHVIPVLMPFRFAKALKSFVSSSAPYADELLTFDERPKFERCFWVEALKAIVGSCVRKTEYFMKIIFANIFADNF